LYEFRKVSHDFTTGTRLSKHFIADARVRFYKATNALAGIHQLLKAPYYLTKFDFYRADLYTTITLARG
jgi:hypothetical protein